jgi:hypothetical protein
MERGVLRALAVLLAVALASFPRAAAQCACGGCSASQAAAPGANATLFQLSCAPGEAAFLTSLRVTASEGGDFRLFTQAAINSSRFYAAASAVTPVPCFAVAPLAPPGAPVLVGGLYSTLFVSAACQPPPGASGCVFNFTATAVCQGLVAVPPTPAPFPSPLTQTASQRPTAPTKRVGRACGTPTRAARPRRAAARRAR